ncbi:MAG: protoporphyrinogen oxidase [Chloroflexota bacterium]|nr:protoporphyrinogen oxidase [Chloroflexota bacterium]
MKRVVVIGGGVSGLAAAYRLHGRAAVTLLEAGQRLGGVVRTERRGGYVMETGPDSFLNKLGIEDLCRELGLEKELIPARRENARSFVLRGRRLYPLEGLYLMAPTSMASLVRSPLVSPLGKARMALDLVLPARRDGQDETLASFVRRRLGREALDRVAQPLVGGIYTADPERLSLAATMPQFLEMERQHGSVMRALWSKRKQTAPASGARYSLFLSFRGGMQTLVDALAARIDPPRLGTRVSALARTADSWDVQLDGGEHIEADAVCLCIPAREVARLVPQLGELGTVPYGSPVTINFGFRREQVRHPLDGMGLVIPNVEGRSIIACSFSSTKFEGRASEGHVLLRAFVGETACAASASDEEVASRALRDLDDLLGVTGQPEQVMVSRLPASLPQYALGHLELLKRVEAAAAQLPCLALAGNGYRGVGVPDCIASGFAAAERLLAAAG